MDRWSTTRCCSRSPRRWRWPCSSTSRYVLWAFRERNPEVYRRRASDPRQLQRPVLVAGSRPPCSCCSWRATARCRLLADGSGGGQGPNPIAMPAAPKGATALPVQVIAQQWQFTYRFPGYGGVETRADRAAREHPGQAFNVTSLDVIHSFWAYELGRQGRRQPGREQRRVRGRPGDRSRSTCAARSCAGCGTATCSTPAPWCRRRSSPRGSPSSGCSTRRRPRTCRRTRRRYFPQPLRRGG